MNCSLSSGQQKIIEHFLLPVILTGSPEAFYILLPWYQITLLYSIVARTPRGRCTQQIVNLDHLHKFLAVYKPSVV